MVNEEEKRLVNHIDTFLRSERNTALFLMGWAVVVLVLTAWCWLHIADWLVQGLAFPMMVFAALHLATGFMQWMQWRQRRRKLVKGDEPPEYSALMEELLRLEIQMPRLQFFRKTSLGIFLFGFAMMLVGMFAGWGEYVVGTGIGLTVQSAVTLAVDLFKSMRTGLFHHELKRYMS